MAMWTHFRRLAASLMLVAMTSFVLHGAAVAGSHRHGPGSAGCGQAASLTHVHGGHDHGAGSAHVHAAEAHSADASLDHASMHGVDDDHPADGTKTPCCGDVCAVAVQTAAPDVGSGLITHSTSLLPTSQLGSGIGPEGLKRPPRTPCIA